MAQMNKIGIRMGILAVDEPPGTTTRDNKVRPSTFVDTVDVRKNVEKISLTSIKRKTTILLIRLRQPLTYKLTFGLRERSD